MNSFNTTCKVPFLIITTETVIRPSANSMGRNEDIKENGTRVLRLNDLSALNHKQPLKVYLLYL